MPINQFIPTQAPGLAQTPTGAGLGAYSQAISNAFAPQMMRSQMFNQQMMPLSIMGQSPMMGLIPQYRDAWAMAMTHALRNLNPNAPDIGKDLAPLDELQNAAYKNLGSGVLKLFGINSPNNNQGQPTSGSQRGTYKNMKGVMYYGPTGAHFVADDKQG